MSDDFGTINVKRGERAREIEILRQQYRRHREALVNMAADSPTDLLASEYRRLIQTVDGALLKLDELENGPRDSGHTRPAFMPPSPPAAAVPPPPPPAAMAPVIEDDTEVLRHIEPPVDAPEPSSGPRVALIVAVALIALGVVGWLIWRASSDRQAAGTIAEQPADSTTAMVPEAKPDTQEPAVASELTITPPSQDYGVIRKGTRAARQFEITNRTAEPISISIARSSCRCLYYEHAEVVAPGGKESITVTIDGARAKAGELHETLKVTSKKNPAVSTSFDVTATVR